MKLYLVISRFINYLFVSKSYLYKTWLNRKQPFTNSLVSILQFFYNKKKRLYKYHHKHNSSTHNSTSQSVLKVLVVLVAQSWVSQCVSSLVSPICSQEVCGDLPLTLEELDQVFDRLDREGSGYITSEDLSAALSEYEGSIPHRGRDTEVWVSVVPSPAQDTRCV